MLKTVKYITICAALSLLTACATPYHGYSYSNNQAQGRYVRIPPAKPQPRKVVVRTESHRVLTPKIIMEPCCRMQPDVISPRRYYQRYEYQRYNHPGYDYHLYDDQEQHYP